MDWDPLILSLEIASVATVTSVLLGTAVALVLGWRRLPVPDAFHALVMTPLVLPPTVLGYYLLVVLGRASKIGKAWHWLTGGDIAFTFKGAVIAATVGALPLVVNAVRVGLDAIDPQLVAAARTLGAGRARLIATVTLPLAAPSIVAGAMLAFARSLGDYGMTQMLAGPRFDGFGVESTSPAAIYAYDQFYGGHEDATIAMSLATTLVGVVLLFFATRITRRMHPHRG